MTELRCAECGGPVEETAVEGDLCVGCTEAFITAAEIEQEMREDRRLDDKLRARP